MIIGSLVLPGFIIYSTAVTTIVIFILLTLGEYFNVIPHHSISGFLGAPVYNDFKYVSAFLSIFTFIMIMSVVLANRIAQQLYKMEQDLVESFNRLKAAEIEKQKYIMSVVHEIKTPIAALHSYLDLILQKFLGPLDEKVEEKLNRAIIRSDEAIQLINNVLQISRLRLTGETTKEPLDLRELICSVITKHKINIEAKKIKFEIKDEIKKINKIKGDSLLLEIAFSNLLGNAVKYAAPEGIVEIRLNKTENEIFIEICDNGIGIPSGEIEKIFHDFYRASNIKQRGYEGSGMGLSIVKQIVEKHGGTIKVKSPSDIGNKNNPGTSVKVSIPLL
jgi:signal transduction histidine kinase